MQQFGYPSTMSHESAMEFELRQPRYGVDRRLHLVMTPARTTESVPYASAPGIPVLNYMILSVMLIFTSLMYQQARASHGASAAVPFAPGTVVPQQQRNNHDSPPPSAVAVLRLASCAALAHQGEGCR